MLPPSVCEFREQYGRAPCGGTATVLLLLQLSYLRPKGEQSQKGHMNCWKWNSGTVRG